MPEPSPPPQGRDRIRIPIYRHDAFGDRHYYDQLKTNDHGWSRGVAAFYAYRQQEPGTIPIYLHRWISKGGGDPDRYFLDQQIPNNFNWTEGVPWFYAYNSAVAETVPVYQYRGENTYYYFSTESKVPGHTNERIAFYAYPPPPEGIIDSVVRILSEKPSYDGVTYFRSSGRSPGQNFKLLQTPAVWGGGKSPKMPSAACIDFLKEIEETIGSARNQLDITTLFNIASKDGFPDGSFQGAISRGLQQISTNKYNPVVRILFGLPIVNKTLFRSLLKKFGGGIITIIYNLHTDPGNKEFQKALVTAMQNWLTSTTKGIDINYPIYMAFSQASPTSHNHAKMIVADDSRVITGGHNLWDSDYLSGKGDRVHDISCLIHGQAAKGARQFADKLWSQTIAQTCWKKPKFVTASPPSPPAPERSGSGNMLALGKLGSGWGEFNITSNASKTARVIALCSAKSIIRISQQTLGAPLNLLALDFYTCLAVLRAVLADVRVQILVSQKSNALDAYSGFAAELRNELVGMYKDDVLTTMPQYRAAPLRNNLDAWADLSLTNPSWQLASLKQLPKNSDAARKLQKNLQISRLHSSANVAAYNHSKIYVVDQRCLYIGSDNFYVSGTDAGLQEFGYLIEDHTHTRSFINNYWADAWRNAKPLPLL